jgi:hypothetical protein
MRSLLTALQKGMNKMPNIQSLVSEIGLGQSGIARINCIWKIGAEGELSETMHI